MTKRSKIFKKLVWALTICFGLLNIVAFFHAYKFTHFASPELTKTKSVEKLSSFDKLKTLLLGVDNPRPVNSEKPAKYKAIQLQSNKRIDCWHASPSDSAKGTVVLFHGYSGEKSSMLDKAEVFEKLNYQVLLVDFMGSGASEGNETTLGFHESVQVKTVYDYLKNSGERNIYLFGTSMGAVAVMKAIAKYGIRPTGVILECPFGSMYQTTCARFRLMQVPCFPMAGLLVFWGGAQHKFWAFGHNPTSYAKHITCPSLLLYGEQDKNVSRQEIDQIYQNLSVTKTLKTYARAGHENYLLRYRDQWTQDVSDFLLVQSAK